MKHVFIFLISLSSLNAFGIWDPPEKEIITILRKAERTPEATMNRMYSSIEQMRVDRAYYEANPECGEEHTHRFGGITKYTIRLSEVKDCRVD